MSTLQYEGSARRSGGPASVVHVERIANCPFSFAVDLAHVIFPMLESRSGGVRVPYRALGLPFPGALAHRVNVRFARQPDKTDPGRLHDEIDFDWDALSHWLPKFHGVLRFRIESSQTRIFLSGEYTPPAGSVGGLFDRFIGHGLALATARDLVNRLSDELEARWALEERA